MKGISDQDRSYSISKVTVIGLIAGIVGAVLGFIPFAILHEFLGGLVRDMPGDTSTILFILAYGLPLPIIVFLFVLPLGGIIMGIIGANVGVKRSLKKKSGNKNVKAVAFWWGLIFGFLFNLFVGFFNQ